MSSQVCEVTVILWRPVRLSCLGQSPPFRGDGDDPVRRGCPSFSKGTALDPVFCARPPCLEERPYPSRGSAHTSKNMAGSSVLSGTQRGMSGSAPDSSGAAPCSGCP